MPAAAGMVVTETKTPSSALDRLDDEGSTAVEAEFARPAQHGVGPAGQDVALDRVAVGTTCRPGADHQGYAGPGGRSRSGRPAARPESRRHRARRVAAAA